MKIKILIFVATLVFQSELISQNNAWVRTILKTSSVVEGRAQSVAVKNVLLHAFSVSNISAKKVFRDMEISPLDIQKITRRYGNDQLADLARKLDVYNPSTIKTVYSDLARYDDTRSKIFLQALIKDPKLIKTYERIHSSLSVKFRMNVKVLKDINNDISPVRIKTTKSSYVGKSIDGVVYRTRIISIGGIKYEGVFPDFKEVRAFYTVLPKNLYMANDDAQMKNVTRYLRKKIAQDSDLKNKFTSEQLDAILNGRRKIPGYTWHHKEAPVGAMELVPSKLHDTAPHDGGKAFWNGGNRTGN